MKRIISAVFCVVLIFSLCFPVFADMPYWYPENTEGFTDFHGENLRRVVDDADIFTDEEEAELNRRMNEVVDNLGIGYALFTDNDNHGLSPEEYSSDFLHFGGYGVGENYGAVVFYISFEEGKRCWRTTSINSYESIFNAETTFVIDELVDADIRAGRYYNAYLTHIEFVEKLFLNGGEIPAEYDEYVDRYSDYEYGSDDSSDDVVSRFLICIAVAVVIGLIVGGMRLSSLKKAMKVVAPVDAREYLKKDSFVLRDKKTFYLYSTVTKSAKQKSSGSGGGSSFSSGSSSGGSYSSGGRSF
ncbi:MAG: TPM domain-containing protein [Clostridia bacterium]|nr:TPM domain-containing protein [Clostridia bacterium]